VPQPRSNRDRLTLAAIALFLANGYEETTVDDIADAAGVARRTFFRHFRTKEDAVFPDHDGCLARVREHLDQADASADPFAVTSRAAHLVLDLYAQDPATAAQRYQLTRQVESLREREITTTSRYQRVFADYLHRCDAGKGEDDRLRLDVTAAAVVAAHNHILRKWIREGGSDDIHARLDAALGSVEATLRAWPTESAPHTDELLVLVARPGTPTWRLVREIQAVEGRR